MFKLKKGNIQTICYTQEDVDNYIKAGWKIVVEETKVEETIKEPIVENTEFDKKINRYSSLKNKR